MRTTFDGFSMCFYFLITIHKVVGTLNIILDFINITYVIVSNLDLINITYVIEFIYLNFSAKVQEG